MLLGATGADEGAAAAAVVEPEQEPEPEPVGRNRADDVSTASDTEGGLVTYGRRKVALSEPDPGDDGDDDDEDEDDDESDDDESDEEEEEEEDDNLLRAEALYDFAARNETEISFTKGGALPRPTAPLLVCPPAHPNCRVCRVVSCVVCGACRGLDRAREGHQRMVEGGGAKEAEEAGARQRHHQRRRTTCGAGDDRGGALQLPPRPLQGPLLQLQALLQGSPF